MLVGDERVIQAARIANVFHQDPVAFLRDDGDEFLMLVRIAAARIVQHDEETRQAKSAKHGR